MSDTQGGHLWESEYEQLCLDESLIFDWRREWQMMPEYRHEDLAPFASYPIHFRSEADLRAFIDLVGEERWSGKAFWYPPDEIGVTRDRRYVRG